VLRVIGPLWTDRYDTAKKVRQRLSLAFRWAMAAGHRPDDPAGEALLAALPRNGVPRRHMAALPPAQVPAALAAIDNSAAYPTTKLAMRMLALTATRSGEVRRMCWDEIEGDTWTIPGERTKVGREFRVPLSPEALAVLRRGTPLQRRRSRLAGVPVRTRPADHSRRPLQALPRTGPGHDPSRAPLIVPRLVRRVGRQPRVG